MTKRTTWLAWALAIGCTFLGAAGAQAEKARNFRAAQVNAMTQNLYVGANLFKILEAQDPTEIPGKVTEIVLDVQATNFHDRAEAIADLIEQQNPHLIGLQEVSELLYQCPGDAAIGGETPAETPYLDYLDILLDALEARGLDYEVGAEITNADVELPAVAYVGELGNFVPVIPGCEPAFPFFDIRLIDHDTILVRSDVEYDNSLAANFTVNLTVPTAGGEVEFTRGWTAVDATIRGRTFTFFNTHLEVSGNPFARTVQAAQAGEMAAILAGNANTIVAVGDFNSSAEDGPVAECEIPGNPPFPCPTPYEILTLAGYTDTWDVRGGPWDRGDTCCQADLLDNEVSQLDERIDLIFVRPAPDHYGGPVARGVSAEVLGEEPEDKSSTGLWPSDHAGVGARMTIRVPK
jgi:hypothetical protein